MDRVYVHAFVSCFFITENLLDQHQTGQYWLLLQPGKANLSMTFTGELNDKMKGFYRSKYKGEDGSDRYAAVTQFEVGTILSPIITNCNVTEY